MRLGIAPKIEGETEAKRRGLILKTGNRNGEIDKTKRWKTKKQLNFHNQGAQKLSFCMNGEVHFDVGNGRTTQRRGSSAR